MYTHTYIYIYMYILKLLTCLPTDASVGLAKISATMIKSTAIRQHIFLADGKKNTTLYLCIKLSHSHPPFLTCFSTEHALLAITHPWLNTLET